MANYVNNKELEKELKNYIDTCEFKSNGKIKTRGYVSENLSKMILDITKGVSNRGNFSSYTWKEDMISEGVLMVLKYMHNFNKNANNANAFWYITKIAYNAFIQYITKQKVHSVIKQDLYDIKHEIENEDSPIPKSIDYEKLKL